MKTHHDTAYEGKIWDEYARAFLALMPSMMLKLNQAVAKLATGHVIDFGCGAAKIAPFVLERDAVNSYTGVDYSTEMVELGRWHLQQFPSKPSCIIHSKIESLDLEPQEVDFAPGLTINDQISTFNFGLSVNSYYTWSDHKAVLRNIFDLLSRDAKFVLVTPNPSININQILTKVRMEQIANPYFDSFEKQNRAIAGNERALFIEMNDLILQVQQAGFKVLEANQDYYDHGLNFLYLSK